VEHNEANRRCVLVVEDDPGIAAVCIRTINIPVIMVTSIGFELNIKLSQQMGATGYVTKPFAPKELLDKIQQILATPEVQVDLSED